MSVGVMGEPKLCRSLTKDKLGKPSKVQLTMFTGRVFCEELPKTLLGKGC